MQNKKSELSITLEADPVTSPKLSVLVERIEELLKSYQYTLAVRTEKKNGKISKVRLETEIFL